MMACVANSMSERGHSVSIINYNSIAYVNSYQQSINESIKIFTYSKQLTGIKQRLNKILFTYQIVKRCRPCILVCFTAFPSFVGRIVGFILKTPSIMSERGNPYITINKKNIHSRLELFVINHSNGAVFQIEGAAKFYSKKLQAKAEIIPNPIIINTLIDPILIENREKSIVSVGRFDNFQKRYDIMIKAFSIFVRKHSEYILKLYGEGPDEEKIKQWAFEENIQDKVIFMGLSKNPIKDICRDGIFLITSDYEGISNSLLEAMAAGLPCVSTDSFPGGARMLIDNKVNGILCPIGNPYAIAEAMSEFVENPQLAHSCGQNAKNVITRFDKKQIMDRWEYYIKQIAYKYNGETNF